MLRLTIALAATLAANSAAAQAPTLEGAMRFLELSLPGHEYNCLETCAHRTYRMDQVVKSGPCQIQLTVTSQYYPTRTVQIDFTRVTYVQQALTNAEINQPGGRMWLNGGSDEFGARLTYAANFARLKCDRTASTGF